MRGTLAMKTILLYTLRFNPGYDGFFLSLMREGRRRGWRFAWLTHRDAPDEAERVARMFELLKPAGFVGGAIRGIVRAVPRGFPSVWVDCGDGVPKGAVAVEHDNASFGAAAAGALGNAGSTFAAFGFAGHRWSDERVRAFASAIGRSGGRCRRFGFPKDALETPYLAFERLCAILAGLPRPVSAFAVTDRLADVALMAAESLGLRCPGDFRIVGVDDDEMVCMSPRAPLSSVRPDWAEGGRLAAEALEIQMRGGRPRKKYLYGAAGVTRRASTRIPYRRPKDDRVERALSFIDAEYASRIGVAEVVRAMGCSRSLAELRFREETGKTILEALTEKRWEKLLVHLRRRDADLSALPDICGFRSAAALRELFRHRTGMSMTEWRRKNG